MTISETLGTAAADAITGGVLCPIDFSEPSRGALRYAAVIAAHLDARLTVLTVNDPLLAQAADMAGGVGSLDADAKLETKRFAHDTFGGPPPGVRIQFEVATGKPDAEILRVANAGPAYLVVMSSRGATGIRRLFLGSITERVLRAAIVPILVTPPGDPGPASAGDVQKTIRRILVPVDLTGAMDDQVRVAKRLGIILRVPLVVAHVVEPVRAFIPGHIHAANVDSERRDRAERRLQSLVDAFPPPPRTEPLVVFGEPAEEIAKIATDRQSGLIVIGSPRIGCFRRAHGIGDVSSAERDSRPCARAAAGPRDRLAHKRRLGREHA